MLKMKIQELCEFFPTEMILFEKKKKKRRKNRFDVFFATEKSGVIKCARLPLSCVTIVQFYWCWTQGLSASSSAYTISSCTTSTPTHSCSAGYFETDWWRPRKGGSAPNYLCMFLSTFLPPCKLLQY